MRAIIVGGGIMGLSTAWALRRSGHEPVLYDHGPIPNPLASPCDEHSADPLHLRGHGGPRARARRVLRYGRKFGAVMGEAAAPVVNGERSLAAITAWAAGHG